MYIVFQQQILSYLTCLDDETVWFSVSDLVYLIKLLRRNDLKKISI